ncbi:MAG TPA: hypothetical protein VJM15_08775 [Sphingomicrobium sp.]|nr:hypothetical protein [Sphingomicrobium sp.]
MPEQTPRPDPVPSPRHSLMRRFWRIFRLLAFLSVAIAALAVLLMIRGEESPSVHFIVATALGAGLTVLLGTALMTLVFLSSSSGHDDAATPRVRKENGEE